MTFVAPTVLSVLQLFEGALAGMRFADVDAEGLARLAANVESAGAEVAHAESKLTELRQQLATEQEALLALAQRALAYARVYAESDEELLASLNGIALPRPTKARKVSANKPVEAESVTRGSAEAVGVEAELTPVSEASAAESDPDQKDANAMRGPSARKARRNRPTASAPDLTNEGAGASE